MLIYINGIPYLCGIMALIKTVNFTDSEKYTLRSNPGILNIWRLAPIGITGQVLRLMEGFLEI